MKKIFIFILIFLSISANIYSSTIYGIVYNKKTNDTVSNVTVKIHGNEVVSNNNGEFAINNLRNGTSIVEARHPSFIPYFTTKKIKNGEIIKIYLIPNKKTYDQTKKNSHSQTSNDISDYVNNIKINDTTKEKDSYVDNSQVNSEPEIINKTKIQAKPKKKKGIFSFLNVFKKKEKRKQNKVNNITKYREAVQTKVQKKVSSNTKRKNNTDLEYLYSRSMEKFAKEEYEQALSTFFILSEHKDFKDIYRVYYYIGAIYKQLKFYDQAHSYFIKALGVLNSLEVNEQTLNDRSLCYLEIGEIYVKREMYLRAKKMFLTASENEKVNNPDLSAKAYQGMGFIERQLENFSLSLSYYEKAIKIVKSDKLRSDLYSEIGDVYYNMKKIPDAAKNYKISYSVSKKDEVQKKIIFMDALSKYETFASQQKPELILKKVIPRLKDALEVDEDYIDVMYSIGYIEFLVGRSENKIDIVMDAKSYIETVLKKDFTYRPVGGIPANDLLMKINNYLKDF